MTEEWPKIRARRVSVLSRWMSVIERHVEFTPGAPLETYHSIGQRDYLAILAVTPDGRIPIVRQYRPALEAFTWELPAGLVDDNETPEESCRRELMEETGFPARHIHLLGTAAPCTGRMSNRIHSFFVESGPRAATFTPEPGVMTKLVTPAELLQAIKCGEFVQQLHLGTLLLAELRSFIKLA
ncbi:MAG TPA: NUDIX hydrolase [Xanthobacteraceae bacterium]|nr:NUDIX hydrolase [Xanthobacteraceae bacterium]